MDDIHSQTHTKRIGKHNIFNWESALIFYSCYKKHSVRILCSLLLKCFTIFSSLKSFSIIFSCWCAFKVQKRTCGIGSYRPRITASFPWLVPSSPGYRGVPQLDRWCHFGFDKGSIRDRRNICRKICEACFPYFPAKLSSPGSCLGRKGSSCSKLVLMCKSMKKSLFDKLSDGSVQPKLPISTNFRRWISQRYHKEDYKQVCTMYNYHCISFSDNMAQNAAHIFIIHSVHIYLGVLFFIPFCTYILDIRQK